MAIQPETKPTAETRTLTVRIPALNKYWCGIIVGQAMVAGAIASIADKPLPCAAFIGGLLLVLNCVAGLVIENEARFQERMKRF